ncbi:MAG TPA: efflux RND transporter permease subunit [Euzebyales bacterium]|nr:efflux RND transporter permease subunit [Euzebyales bacterium]
MRNVTRLALAHRTVTILAVVLLLAASIGAALGLRQELFPSIQPPFVVIVATQPGSGPLSVVEDLSEPIEDAVRTTADVEQVASTSLEGVSIVFAEYTYGTDVDERLREVRDAIADAGLPQDVATPDVTSITPDALPIYTVALSGGEEGEAADVARDDLVPELERVDGVAEVGIGGGGAEIVEVLLDPERLANNNLTTNDVANAIAAADLSTPVGVVTEGDSTQPVRVAGPRIDLEALRDVRVRPSGAAGGQAAAPAPEAADPEAAAAQEQDAPRLEQLGEVELTREDTETISRLDGETAVTLQIRKEQDANTVATVERIEEAIEEADLPRAIDTAVIVNQAPEITQGVSDVTRDALFGAALALTMIIIFLRSWRGTVVAGISIPLSLIAALGLMRLTGVTVNILTLGAMAIAAGRVVDDAIVVLENIYRQLESGLPLGDAVRRGTREVAGAVTSATLTAVAVFAPLAFISGLVGEVFIGFALTTTFALLVSLLVATTIVPVLGSLLLRREEAEKADPRNSPLRRLVRRPLTWALDHRGITVALAIAALFGSLASLQTVPVNLFPSGEAENIVIEVDTEEGTSLDATSDTVVELEERIEGTDGVDSYTTVIGSSSDGISAAFGGSGGDSTATITVAVDDESDVATSDLRDTLSAELDDLNLTGSVVEQSAIPTGNDATVQISGDDFADVTAVTEEVEEELASVEGLANLTSNLTQARPELTVDVREDDALDAGLDATAIAQLLGASLNATTATSVDIDSGERDVVVLVDPETVNTAERLRDLPLPGDLTLSDVADVEEGESPAAITRADGERSAEVTATITAANIGQTTQDINAVIDDIDPPDGVGIAQVGGNEEIGESFQDLFVTMAIAVGLVYLILVATFGSLTTPFVILLTLPLAAIGAFPALALTGRELGLPSMIGLLMLIGIVITNAIVLLEFVEQRRAAGMSIREALIDGAETRVRPILMTALTTMFGLVPLALGLSEGALLSAALATVVIGGLLTSTLLTLIVIPVMYSLFGGARERISGGGTRRGGDDTTPPAPPTRPREPVAVGSPATAAPAGGQGAAPGGDVAGDPVPAGSGGRLAPVRRFTTRAEAEGARSYLSAAGMQADRFVIRPGSGGPPRARDRLNRLAADWLRRRQPELLASSTSSWELAAPPDFVATARTVLSGNGQVFDRRAPR